MNENLQKSNGLYNSQRVMLLSLIKKGLSRESAYKNSSKCCSEVMESE